jgi:hypothetical protein
LIASSIVTQAADRLVIEEGPLTKEEVTMFKRISKFDKSFHYSKKAKRYYRIHPETKTKLPILVELKFEPDKGSQLLFGEYISYEVSYQPDSFVVDYAFDGGTGNRGEGTVLVATKEVVQTEWNCGVSACILEVKRNGKLLFESK